MGSVRIRSFDGSTLIPADRITSLDVVGTGLVAQVPSMGGPFVLAEGTPHELSDAAKSLMPGVAELGEGDWTLRATRSSTGIGWHGTALMPGSEDAGDPQEIGGAGFGAVSTAHNSKLTIRYD